MWPAITVPLLAFTISALAVGWLARSRVARLALDQPNARSLHSTPVPRSGGLGLLAGATAGCILPGPMLPSAPLLIALAITVAVSVLDDLRGLSAGLRLTAHLLAAGLAAVTLVGSESLLILIAATLGIGWMCNLYNFMDGSDGLAGGMALFGFSAYAIAAWLSGSTPFALMNAAVAAAAGGFLLHNFHPARIFMGDAGSVPLGFLAAAFGLAGWLQQNWGWWFPLLVFSPFIVDATLTLARRLFTGARVWEAHRDHYYQRLVRLGLGHRRTALLEYALMLACGIAALWALTLEESGRLAVIAACSTVYVGGIATVELAWAAHNKDANA